MKTVSFYEGVELFISVLGLMQAGFFCVLLLSEGKRALRANRWMMLFIAAVCANLIEDVVDVFGGPALNFYDSLIFLPFNFVITPAIYLYFCEAAGRTKLNYRLHFAVVPIVANLTFWLLIGIGPMPVNGELSYELAERSSPLMVALLNILHFGLYVQAVIYVVLLWRVAVRYFRQVQKQLGAQRQDMVRWLRNVLGSVSFIFLVFVVQEVASDFRWDAFLWSFQFLNVAFLLVFFWLSYTLATHQVVFVLPDWDDTEGHDMEDGADPTEPGRSVKDIGQMGRTSDEIPSDAAFISLYDKGAGEKTSGGISGDGESPIRHFLDKTESGLVVVDAAKPVTGLNDLVGNPGLAHTASGMRQHPGSVGSGSFAGNGEARAIPDDDAAAAKEPGLSLPIDVTTPRPVLDEEDAARAKRRLMIIHGQGDLLHDPMISLPKLARAVGLSPNQLSYVLNHHIGQNFFDFVNSARIAEARRILLGEPDRPILDVALAVGFNSKSTFNLAFKKITGETPSSLRRKENGTS
ncbi:helix-turn-helix domain-containing protein [Thalassospira profundimaris]|uniref:helix-turn-helix domain-containing protein n=1 Tax=Thalassospira profundimaris TaxID=502049 RepID=UPI00215D6B14|nr:helix-turn-helix domain-containing protein [Thalassospira profundimaris]